MLDNHLYNLMQQCVAEHKSLWRIKNDYPGDSADCGGCSDFWQKMIKDKEDHIEELLKMIKEHLA